MFKKLFILFILCSSLFSEEIRELTDENFGRATSRGLVAVEFWATWNEANKVSGQVIAVDGNCERMD